MKITFKKLLSFALALIMLLGICSLAFAQGDEDVNMLINSTEEIEVSIIYSPITSRIVYNKSKPMPYGMILKITYLDGKNEFVMVRKYKDGYVAGEFFVQPFCYFLDETGQAENYGIQEAILSLGKTENNVCYDGEVRFNVISIPNATEFSICMEKALSKYF